MPRREQHNSNQQTLFGLEIEDQDYLREQLITYIGNKRALLKPIEQLVMKVKEDLGLERIRSADLFAGSGVVARLLKRHSSVVRANDLEGYSKIINSCYLSNRRDVPWAEIEEAVSRLNARAARGEYEDGFIRELYAAQDESNIRLTDRLFYSVENAKRLDSYAQWIQQEQEVLHNYLLAPLMSKASIHVNTAGVFKGFYKDLDTKMPAFGGAGKNALSRILGEIKLEVPLLSNFYSDFEVYQEDARDLAGTLPESDLVYLDPPYNQHPYGANYFMLNYLHDYRPPLDYSKVSGIPVDWKRSDFNVRTKSLDSLRETIAPLSAKYVLISFNNEGFISPEEMRGMLSSMGVLTELEIDYTTYRGSRNLSSRSSKVKEYLFLLKKG